MRIAYLRLHGYWLLIATMTVIAALPPSLHTGMLLYSPSLQQTMVARPTLDPTRMPLTTMPLATIRAALTATVQQATIRAALTATVRQTLTPMPTPSIRNVVTATVAPLIHVPPSGQTRPFEAGPIVLGIALLCCLGGVLLLFVSKHQQPRDNE